MKKAIFLFLILKTIAHAQIDVNYYSWSKMSETQKLTLVRGIIRGYYYCQKELYNSAPDDSKVIFSILFKKYGLPDSIKEKFCDQLRVLYNRNRYGSSCTMGQYTTGIDEFYKNYLNHNIMVEELIFMVDLKFIGIDDASIERILQEKRR